VKLTFKAFYDIVYAHGLALNDL